MSNEKKERGTPAGGSSKLHAGGRSVLPGPAGRLGGLSAGPGHFLRRDRLLCGVRDGGEEALARVRPEGEPYAGGDGEGVSVDGPVAVEVEAAEGGVGSLASEVGEGADAEGVGDVGPFPKFSLSVPR